MNVAGFTSFIGGRLSQKKGKLVPARLQAALALLERLRTNPDLDLNKHLAKGGQSLKSHEAHGDRAHERFRLEKINRNHGRRSSNIREWGADLLRLLRDEGFDRASPGARAALLDKMQALIAERIRALLDSEPLAVRVARRSARAVVLDLLEQAQKKGHAATVSQYLVGAKLLLKYPEKRDRIAVAGAYEGDRKSRDDERQRRGDFDLVTHVFEVTVGPPDDKHIEQMTRTLADPDVEFWLLVREDKLQSWNERVKKEKVDLERVNVVAIEQFIGQNVAEMGLGTETKEGQVQQLNALIGVYNEEWASRFGSGITIRIT